jgi:hypothetical protein
MERPETCTLPSLSALPSSILPERARDLAPRDWLLVQARRQACARIWAGVQAGEPKLAVIERVSREMQPAFGRRFSPATLRRLYDAWCAGGDSALLPAARPERDSALPTVFTTYLQREACLHRRGEQSAFEALVARWRMGEEIPGYGTWRALYARTYPHLSLPAVCPADLLPRGWSARNLRRYLPSEAVLTLAKRGSFAAHGDMVHVHRDWSVLLPMQELYFDDVRVDWLIVVEGVPQPVQLWLLVCMDGATRRILSWVALARVRDDEGVLRSLCRAHMRTLVAQVVLTYGLPAQHRCKFILENATATLGDEDRAWLTALLGEDRVEFHLTPMQQRRTPGGWTERHGTPSAKACLESFFHLLHERSADTPGWTGPSYSDRPGELESQIRETEDLVETARQLPAELREQIQLPLLTYPQACELLASLFERLNRRTNHRLVGFEKVVELRAPQSDLWQPVQAVASVPRSALVRYQQRHRMESPMERWERLARPIAWMPAPEPQLLAWADEGRAVNQRKPWELSWEERGMIVRWRADLPELAQGTGAWRVRVSPSDPTRAHLYDRQDRYIGELRAAAMLRPGDQESAERAFGEAAHLNKLTRDRAAELLASEAAAQDARRSHNLGVLSRATAPSVPTEPEPAAAPASGADALRAERAKRLARSARSRLPE